MIKFATIIQEAGLNKKDYEKCSEINVTLYDEKNEVNESHFVEPLFSNNPDSLKKFKDFLVDLEKNPVPSMNVTIDANYVVVFYKTPNPKIFSRT